MKKYKNLHILGTSHIAKQSVEEVKNLILKVKPSIVALELDRLRFASLLSKNKRKLKLRDIKVLGVKGFIFNWIGAWVEKKLGEVVGTPPGSEMKQAAFTARKIGAKIALVDQQISITIKRLTKQITWKEKFRFIYDLLKGMILRKPVVKFDLNTVPSEEIIEKLISEVKKNYPTFYRVLIEERNVVMSKNLYKLMSNNENYVIVAVVGAGHEKDIIKLIKELERDSK